ncbi:MAG: DUF853 family protein [Bacteroidia bacterium]|nr:DUF853 family protein [Bacteroidia bacterium]
MNQNFKSTIEKGYSFKGDSVLLGTAMLDKEAVVNTQIKAPLKTFNRHGLISGATGTGKTKTLQNIAERLSEKGVPILLMDLKGDLSGLSQPGNPHPKIDERHDKIGSPWTARPYPVELLTISEQEGVRLRATVSEFGPVLFSKILGANDTQSGVISLVFKYCDDYEMPLLDIKDFRKALQWVTGEAKEEIEQQYGYIAKTSAGAILRKLIALEEQGADIFFGEMSFDVEDLTRQNKDGLGYINILRLTDIQDKPKLFSTFMLCLLAEVYEKFPEVGDKDDPKLVIFIEEAHLVFKEASGALLDQIESIIKLIRSKGVGIYFSTQNPTDIPEAVLSQLGMKLQHALRAFTAKDRKAIKMVAENYPITEYYDVDKLLTELGIGECLTTVLNEKGIPTPLVHTLLTAPSSRMDIIDDKERMDLISKSTVVAKYNKDIDRKSAYEILNEKLEHAAEIKESASEKKSSTGRSSSSSRTTKSSKSELEKFMGSKAVNTVVRELTRGLLGILKKR